MVSLNNSTKIYGKSARFDSTISTTIGPTLNIPLTASSNDYYWEVKPSDKDIANAALENLKPVKIIFKPPRTICFFKDGEKIIVKCHYSEEFNAEKGVMACIIKKLFSNRNEFLNLIFNHSFTYKE